MRLVTARKVRARLRRAKGRGACLQCRYIRVYLYLIVQFSPLKNLPRTQEHQTTLANSRPTASPFPVQFLDATAILPVTFVWVLTTLRNDSHLVKCFVLCFFFLHFKCYLLFIEEGFEVCEGVRMQCGTWLCNLHSG